MKENTYIYKEPFLLESGSVLPGIRIHYHCSPGFMTGRKVVWICHALTANSNPLEWWPTMVGPGKFLDSGREYIVCANVQGSCYGSTQPHACLLYTSDAADDLLCVDLGGRRLIKKKQQQQQQQQLQHLKTRPELTH